MEILKEKDLVTTEGGAISLGVGISLVGLGIFIIGIIDGFMRPYKCRS